MTKDEFSQTVLHRTAKRLADSIRRDDPRMPGVAVMEAGALAPAAAEVVNGLIAEGVEVTAAMLWAVPLRFAMPDDPERIVKHVEGMPRDREPRDGQIHVIPEFAP